MQMNAYEIDEAADRFKDHPVLGPATQFLKNFKNVVNENSDGWAYWKAAGTSAEKLMDLIQKARHATVMPPAEEFQKAMRPIKSLCTKHDLKLPPMAGKDEFIRDTINQLIAARVATLDDAEVARVFNTLFDGTMTVVRPGLLKVSKPG